MRFTLPGRCRVVRRAIRRAAMVGSAAIMACTQRIDPPGASAAPMPSAERVSVIDFYPGVVATIVSPRSLDLRKRVDLILYALPNGNSTAETIGRRAADSAGWRFDIQHIGAQTRALRALGMPQAVVVYLEADTRSWPEWRRRHGYDIANRRIVEIVNQVRSIIGASAPVAVTLTGHSGGGSFTWGFIDGQAALPVWLERIAFLDSNYSFEPGHGDRIAAWLAASPIHRMVSIAYDDREIMLDGRKVVSDSGGTWRASLRMLSFFSNSRTFATDTLGAFIRHRDRQVDFLMHPNPANRILHTEMIGEMNGYMHALLAGRPAYERGRSVLAPPRAYTRWIEGPPILPVAVSPPIPARVSTALTGSQFIASIAALSRDAREAAVLGELMSGNLPAFVRTTVPVTTSVVGIDGRPHSISFDVLPDYLAIGSDADFVRMPMTPYTAQAFADAHGFVLPTPKMVDDIWTAATRRVEPIPLTELREASPTFLQHHRLIEAQLAGTTRPLLLAGIKKDVVITRRLGERDNRVAIYGWHHLDGQPIQPLYLGHVDWYVDYSHGIRLVRRKVRVDGVPVDIDRILADSALAAALSGEGPVANLRYLHVAPR